MKRDWDLIKRILVHIEDSPATSMASSHEMATELNVDHAILFEHLQLLKDEGLIEGTLRTAQIGAGIGMIRRLTWSGHDLLGKMRNDNVWTRIKNTAKEKGLELSVDLIKMLGGKIIESMIAS